MTATIVIPAERLEAKRRERERRRREREALAGSILSTLDDDNESSAPALPAERREPTR
jgi:hypothetical protein